MVASTTSPRSTTAPSTSTAARWLRSDLAMLGDCALDHSDCSVCYQVASCCSDQVADLGQHVEALEKHTVGIVLDLATSFLRHLPASSGTTWIHVV
jgi:hypothetical protein